MFCVRVRVPLHVVVSFRSNTFEAGGFQLYETIAPGAAHLPIATPSAPKIRTEKDMILARKPSLALAAALLTAAFGGISTQAQSNQSASTAQRQTIRGIDNFAQVNGFLFRGAQ